MKKVVRIWSSQLQLGCSKQRHPTQGNSIIVHISYMFSIYIYIIALSTFHFMFRKELQCSILLSFQLPIQTILGMPRKNSILINACNYQDLSSIPRNSHNLSYIPTFFPGEKNNNNQPEILRVS